MMLEINININYLYKSSLLKSCLNLKNLVLSILFLSFYYRLNNLIRDIAQLGRAPALGAGCRRFKSCYPDNLY